MNINFKSHKLIGALLFALSLLLSPVSSTGHGGFHGGGFHGGGFHGGGFHRGGFHGGGFHRGGFHRGGFHRGFRGFGGFHGGRFYGGALRRGGFGFGPGLFLIGPTLGYYGYQYYYNCGWTRGRWINGYFIPPQRVCWSYY
jgi:hypothetical protein